MTVPDAISNELCQYVSTYETGRVPATAIHAAARALLDALGVMAAASGMSDDVIPFLALAAEAGSGPCQIIGTDTRTTAVEAAFANGALAHALDYEDAFDPAACHPNASLVPALMAIAQSGAPVARRDLLAALAIGCDVSCRVALCLEKPLEDGGWYPPPIIGGIGAVMGASRLAGLNARQTRDALSLSLCQLICPGEIKHSQTSVIRAIREAFPAQAAIRSVQLAARGVAGFEYPLEGDAGFFRLFADGSFNREALIRDLGETWFIEQLSFKPWPSCRGTHAFIQMGLELHESPDFDWRKIETIHVDIGQIQHMLVHPVDRKQAPETGIDAKFSIPFTLASALVHGQVGLDSFSAAALIDEDVLSMTRRVQVIDRPSWGRDHSTAGGMSVTLTNGRKHTREILLPRGAAQSPMADEDLARKFEDCAGRARNPMTIQETDRFSKALLGHFADSTLDEYLNTTPPN